MITHNAITVSKSIICLTSVLLASILIPGCFSVARAAESLVPGIHGMSTVPGVWFTWVRISSDNEISVNLRYLGTTIPPPINITATALMNNTIDPSMVSNAMRGTQTLNAGWRSPSSTMIKMNGSSSLYDAPLVTVVASPLEQSSSLETTQNNDQLVPTENTNSQTLKILSMNSFIDSIGYLHVVGEVENNTPDIAKFVKVVGTFYDIGSKVVATDFSFAEPTDIRPHDKAPFEVIVTSASIPLSQIDNYKITASSQ